MIELAALLHDVLDKKYVSADEASNPYAYFLPFFRSLASDYDLDLITDGRARLIVRIVENVSWTTEKKLRESGWTEAWHEDCVELHCVQDADRLDAIGALGKPQALSLSKVELGQLMLLARHYALRSIQCGDEPACRSTLLFILLF